MLGVLDQMKGIYDNCRKTPAGGARDSIAERETTAAQKSAADTGITMIHRIVDLYLRK